MRINSKYFILKANLPHGGLAALPDFAHSISVICPGFRILQDRLELVGLQIGHELRVTEIDADMRVREPARVEEHEVARQQFAARDRRAVAGDLAGAAGQ